MVTGLLLTSTVSVFGQVTSTSGPITLGNPSWRLAIDGSVNNPLDLSLSDLAAMPQSQVYGSIYCEGELVSQGNWGGVQVSYLLNEAGLGPQSSCLEFHASDGYAINVSVEAALQQGMIIAYEKDGQPLGEVLRLILPSLSGNYWICEITEITLTGSTDYNIATNYAQSATMPGETKATPSASPTATPQLTSVPTSTPKGASGGAPSSSVSIISPENNQTYTSNNVNFTFAVESTNVQISYSLDGYGGVISGNMTLTGISFGNHTLWVYARDSAGKMNGTEVTFAVTQAAASSPAPNETSAPTAASSTSNLTSTSSNIISFQAIAITVLAVAIVIIVVIPVTVYKRKGHALTIDPNKEKSHF